jgi:hypothetical protein
MRERDKPIVSGACGGEGDGRKVVEGARESSAERGVMRGCDVVTACVEQGTREGGEMSVDAREV